MRKLLRAAAAAGAVAAGLILLTAAPASAAAPSVARHPLGNFSVNQYLGLVLFPDRVHATAIVDIAEIPTLQERPGIDADSDGAVSDAERGAHAATTCQAFAGAVDARVGDDTLEWTVGSSAFEYGEGAGGLAVSRLACALSAPATLTEDATLSLTNGYLGARVGWREISARGDGVGLIDPPVPATSVSDELRAYPDDLLASALDVRSVTLRVTPGAGSAAAAAPVAPSGGDPFSRWLSTVDRYVADLAGGPLTPVVTVAAILLAILLGAGHAALPGHGKTVLAAYLAGRAGRPRDALTVAGTVTLTHTGGVLILGLVITGGSALAGERILGWLGVVSGVVVLAVGASMLRSVLRRRRRPSPHDHGHGHAHGEHHDHAHGHGHGHDHVHGHPHPTGPDHPQGTEDRHDGHDRDHEHSDGDTHGHHGHAHGPHGHDHGHHHSGRWSLAGIGIAGGLVPSPSALVVLLAAIGLGRTAFGVLLVVAYGVGMAGTLTGAGLLLLALQRRLARARNRTSPAAWANRLSSLASRLTAATPAATATLVLVVGAGLALRAATSVV